MLFQKWVFLVTLWVLIISHGSADSGEVLGYDMPPPTGYPLLSPPPPSVSGYPSYGGRPPPSPLSGYPSYRAPPPPRPVSGSPSYGRSPPPPPPPSPSPPRSGYPSYGAPPPPRRETSAPSTPAAGQGCSSPPPPPAAQCCLNGPPEPYEYIPNQNYSAASALVALSWFSVMGAVSFLCTFTTTTLGAMFLLI